MGQWQSWKDWTLSLHELIVRTSGENLQWWLDQVEHSGVDNEKVLRQKLSAGEIGGKRLKGYSQDLVMWSLFGFPDFLTKSPEQLLDEQYHDRPQLRPIADKILALALDLDGVSIMVRRSLAALQGPSRKFAQVTSTTKKTVEIQFRFDETVPAGVEEMKVPASEPMKYRKRFTSVEEVDDGVEQLLKKARDQSL